MTKIIKYSSEVISDVLKENYQLIKKYGAGCSKEISERKGNQECRETHLCKECHKKYLFYLRVKGLIENFAEVNYFLANELNRPRTPEEIEKDWQKPENQKNLKEMIKEFGEYKQVIDAKSGVAYKVPTKDIITKGLKQQDLDKYPIWED